MYSSPRPYENGRPYKKGVNYVDRVKVTQNNGISTPDGAYVGMQERVIEEIYGEPFNKFSNQSRGTTYWYFAETQLLAFEVKDGVVTSIRIEETG